MGLRAPMLVALLLLSALALASAGEVTQGADTTLQQGPADLGRGAWRGPADTLAPDRTLPRADPDRTSPRADPGGAAGLRAQHDAPDLEGGTEVEAPATQPAGLRVGAGTAWTQMAPGEFTFRCPRGPGEQLIDTDDPAGNVKVMRHGCPYRIIDDADLLGSPQLAVRHDDVREVAFFSLHGAASDEGPTSRSRDAENGVRMRSGTHTVFTSKDAGWSWSDNPYGHEGMGESVSGIMTRDGNMFVASLFSTRLGVDAEGVALFDYHIRIHEEQTVQHHVSHRGPRFDNREPLNRIEEVNLVLVTPPRFVENDAQYQAYVNATKQAQQDNGTPPPSNGTQVGHYAMPREPGNHSMDLVAAVWHERAHDWRNATTGKSSWIQAVWRSAEPRSAWQRLPDDQLVGPCRSASDPVAWNGRIYVACVVDAGYRGRADARIGDIDIWAIDPATATKAFVSHVQDLGPDGRPRLAANEHGRFAITSTRILPAGSVDFPSVELSWGWYGKHWSPPYDIGYPISQQWADADLREARVTAMELVRVENSEMLYLSFMQRLNGTLVSDDPAAMEPIEYRKMLGSWERCSNAPYALYDLNVGVARHPFQDGLVGDLTGAFDDLHDGMQAAVDPATGLHLVHFAYGDHGVIQYGALDARSGTGGDCSIPPAPLLYTPPPAAPAALLLPSGLGLGTALGATSAAALMFGSLLVAKRRVALAAALKAK